MKFQSDYWGQVQPRLKFVLHFNYLFKVVELGPGSVPSNLLELRIDNLAELNIGTKAFSNTTALRRVLLTRVKRLHIHSAAFVNISAASFSLQIEVGTHLKRLQCF